MPERIPIEVDIAKENRAIDAGVLELGEPSNYACPECHGVLLEVREDDRVRFRCHTGHAYSPASLAAEIDEKVEDARWNAIRAVDENVMFIEHLARDAEKAHDAAAAGNLRRSAEQARRRGELLREAVLQEVSSTQSESRAE